MPNWNLTLKKETPFIIIPKLKCLRLSLTKYVKDLIHKQPQNTDETKRRFDDDPSDETNKLGDILCLWLESFSMVKMSVLPN